MKICCFGATNVDIFINCSKLLIREDSMPAKIKVGIGGVGSNIAYNLSVQNAYTKFVTVLSNDVFGKYILEHLKTKCLDLSDVQICDQKSSFYVDLNSSLYNYGFNDMKIINQFSSQNVLEILKKTSNYDYICIDLNLPDDILNVIFKNCSVPIVCDATSIDKSKKILSHLKKIKILKCNLNEAIQLAKHFDNSCSDINVVHLAKTLINAGISQIYITLGKDGTLFYGDNKCYKITPIKKYNKHSLGAGDAFTSAVIYGHAQNWNVKEILVYASYLAMCIVNSNSTHIKTRHVLEANRMRTEVSSDNFFKLTQL